MNKEFLMAEEYTINRDTMAIIPQYVNGKLQSYIYEVSAEVSVRNSPLKIMEQSCHYFLCSYNGRREATKANMNIAYKSPVALEPTLDIYMFPTSSPSNEDCAWISHRHVVRFREENFNETVVEFSNRVPLQLKLSGLSFSNQLFRTAQLKSTYQSRLLQAQRSVYSRITSSSEIASESNLYPYITSLNNKS